MVSDAELAALNATTRPDSLSRHSRVHRLQKGSCWSTRNAPVAAEELTL